MTVEDGASLTAVGGGGETGAPGIQASGSDTIKFEGGGSINATGTDNNPGIGGSNGQAVDVEFAGPTVVAQGGGNAPGIGSGASAAGGSITISGGSVTATGGPSSGNGIGTGNDSCTT